MTKPILSSSLYTITSMRFDNAQRLVEIDWADQHKSKYPYIWLRHQLFFPTLGRVEQQDNGKYIQCEAANVAKVIGITQLEDELRISWHHDGSETIHNIKWLRNRCLSASERQARQHQPVCWQGSDAAHFQWFEHEELHDPKSRLAIFQQIRGYGIALIKHVPTTEASLFQIADYFGAVRNTHFGKLFHIRSRIEDKKGTGEGIGATAANAQAPHSDEGWRHGPPGISFFHCISPHRFGGGASLFVDAVGAAEALRKSDPDSFKLLTTVPIEFVAERNVKERFRSRGRLIATDYLGAVKGVRFSDRSLMPFDLPVELIEPMYSAVAAFFKLVYQKQREFEYLFQAGEMAIFDNHRVLHARRSFDPKSSERWLQQLSVDREEFHNHFRQLIEQQGREDLVNWEPDAGVLSQPLSDYSVV